MRYCKVVNSSTSCLVARPKIFSLFIKEILSVLFILRFWDLVKAWRKTLGPEPQRKQTSFKTFWSKFCLLGLTSLERRRRNSGPQANKSWDLPSTAMKMDIFGNLSAFLRCFFSHNIIPIWHAILNSVA